MTDWLERVSHAGPRVSPDWTDSRERALRYRIERGLGRRRAYVRVLGGVALAVSALLLGQAGFAYRFGQTPIAPHAQNARRDGQQLLELKDGTVVTARSNDAAVRPVEVTEREVTVQVEAGSAFFDVVHREDRRFRVQARGVTVTVLGTAFTVQLSGNAVRVRVERGRVDVAWRGTHRQLAKGEEMLATADDLAANRGESEPASSALGALTKPGEATTPDSSRETLDADAMAQEIAADPELVPAPVASPREASRGAVSGPTWRSLAQEGDYRGAFARMSEEGAGAVRDEPGDLLFAADVARLSGHPALAVQRLTRVIRAHGGDSRAPLAAFTLGRTLLDSLGRPREAADAFARARRLSPAGPLSQDALAREVESWSRAGESSLAQQRALQYLKAYPGGRREKAVRYHGGLE
jgi:transmembrane sensor